MIFRKSYDDGNLLFERIINENESLFEIFEKISRALWANESLNITNVIFKQSKVILDVNKALLKLIGDQNSIIDCDINDAPNLLMIRQVYRNCKNRCYKQVQVKRNIDQIQLQEYLSDLFSIEIIGLFKIDKDGLLTQIENLDDEYIVIVERKSCEFIIHSILEDEESTTVDCFNDCKVSELKEIIAHKYEYDFDNFSLFLDNHWLDENDPIYLYQVGNGSVVSYHHLHQIGSVDKIPNSKVTGSFSTIYDARIITTGEMITIKKYNCSGVNYKYMIREWVTLTKIGNNQRLVQLKAFYRDKNALCIGLEHMAGGSIETHIKDKALDENIINKWSKQILHGLRTLHGEGIIHRDLKSSNILLDANNDIKISGFNFSKYLTSSAMSQGLVQSKSGNYNYMAPEVIKEVNSGWKVDIWAFGAVLVEMVTGKPPFHKLNIVDVRKKIEETGTIEYELPPQGISTVLRNFISRCLKSDPHERPSACELLRDKFVV